MNRLNGIRTLTRATLRVTLLAGWFAAAGCSEPVPTDKSEDPTLKASMQKSTEIYKAKSQPNKKTQGAKSAARG